MIGAILKWISFAVSKDRASSAGVAADFLTTEEKDSDSSGELSFDDENIALYFDEKYYAHSGVALELGISPLQHYLTVGEAIGASPSPRFNPRYYEERYPDVAKSGIGLLRHYVLFGEREGRVALAPNIDVKCPVDGLDPSRRTILFLVHDASRTGAPILAWNVIQKLRATYNVVAVLLKGGPLEGAFTDACDAVVSLEIALDAFSQESRIVAQTLVQAYSPFYAIANTLVTRHLAVALEESNVPVVALIHEFAADFSPASTLNPLFARVSKIVFPADIVAMDAKGRYDYLRARNFHTLLHGSFSLPAANTQAASPSLKKEGVFTVLGMGTITYRKGVDLFIATAAAMARDLGRRDFRFIWAGENIPQEWRYKAHMEEQVIKSGLSSNFEFLGELADVAPAYAAADVFFLSSRLDPLPNVAVDAMDLGIPVVCFSETGGVGEVLENNEATSDLVVPYFDIQAAARLLANLSDDVEKRKSLGRAAAALSASLFDTDDYVHQIDQLGIAAVSERARLPEDLAVIKEANVFAPKLYFGQKAAQKDSTGGLIEYLNNTRLARPLSQRGAGLFIRRPVPGFNPLIYGTDHPEAEELSIDPLAHFISTGKPNGRWSHQVIRPAAVSPKLTRTNVALHGHFFYADLVGDFINHLSGNSTPVDLYLSTSGPTQEAEIRKILSSSAYKDAQVWSVPNRGRDIGPLLVDLPGRLEKEYDLVGHVHGKRSRHVSEDVADQWRNFAWQHILGGAYPILDQIVEAFEKTPELGLVFPEDPHLNGWDKNRDLAEELATRMKIEQPLPVHFDFPIGTMFWARPDALQPLWNLGWTWDDFPAEPIPIDGTVMHAIERMISFASVKAGFTYATTYVEEFTR